MFGKNYDEQISKIISQINSNTKTIDALIKSFNSLTERYDEMQDLMIKTAKIQAQHKIMLSFLMDNIEVSKDKAEEVGEMMKEIIMIEKEVKESKNDK